MIKRLRSIYLQLLFRSRSNSGLTSWEEAVRVAAGHSYNDEALNRFRAERFALNKQLDLRKPASPAVSRVVDRIMSIASTTDLPTIVDYGGADGEFLSRLRRMDLHFAGHVIESAALVGALPSILKEEFTYSSQLPPQFEIFYTSSALNYVEHPYEIAEFAFSKATLAVILQRNCFHDVQHFRVQYSSLYANGWGAIPRGWNDSLVSYPHQTLLVEPLLSMARRHGFHLVDLFGNVTGVIGGPRSGQFGVDLVFLKS